MNEPVGIPTLEPLKNATVRFNGTYITVLFRDRDRMTTQFKMMMSFQVKRPVQFIFQTTKERTEEWWTDGVCFNPFGPAKMVTGPNVHYEDHHNPDGSLGAEGGPAHIDHKFGVSYVEKWVLGDSIRHRDDGGPATTEIDYGTPPTQAWEDFLGAENPAAAKLQPAGVMGTCMIRREMTWRHRGFAFREGSWALQSDFGLFERYEPVPPMGIMRQCVIMERELRWYDEQERLHRTDGPAILKLKWVKEIEKDGKEARWSCLDWSGVWHFHGSTIPNMDILRWAKKHNVLMWNNEPCYNRSAFHDAAGEVAFLTDFLGERT